MQINQLGISSSQARKTYTSEAAHLKLNTPLGKDGDPMYCPWPLHIRSCMLAASAADAAGKEFWDRISNDELRGSETFKTDDEMASRQEQLVLEKIETVCNSNSNANEVLSSLRELGTNCEVSHNVGSLAKKVAFDLSMVVFAPNFPNNVVAEERCKDLTTIVTLCEAGQDSGLSAALNNPKGQQIVKAARAKNDQLASSLERFSLLQRVWQDIKANGGSSGLMAVEDAVKRAPSRDAAKATILEDDLLEIRSSLLTLFKDVHYPKEKCAQGEVSQGEVAANNPKEKYPQEKCVQILEQKLTEICKCTELHKLHDETQAIIMSSERCLRSY